MLVKHIYLIEMESCVNIGRNGEDVVEKWGWDHERKMGVVNRGVKHNWNGNGNGVLWGQWIHIKKSFSAKAISKLAILYQIK